MHDFDWFSKFTVGSKNPRTVNKFKLNGFIEQTLVAVKEISKKLAKAFR